jgi:hypothetical protein
MDLLARVYNDAAADHLVKAVVIYNVFHITSFPPDADTEGIGGAIASPQHELVGVAVVIQSSVDGSRALRLGSNLVFADQQPVVGGRVEFESTGLWIVGRSSSVLSVRRSPSSTAALIRAAFCCPMPGISAIS